MPRVKRGNVRRAKRKKLLARAKGFYQTKSKLYRSAKESVDTALKYAFVGRRRKKRDFRRLWVVRINAAARENGLTYGQLISGLKAAGNPIDRKTWRISRSRALRRLRTSRKRPPTRSLLLALAHSDFLVPGSWFRVPGARSRFRVPRSEFHGSQRRVRCRKTRTER